MRYALVKNNIVENMIAWDGVTPYTPPDGALLIGLPDDSPVSIGWLYDPATGVFTPPTGE